MSYAIYVYDKKYNLVTSITKSSNLYMVVQFVKGFFGKEHVYGMSFYTFDEVIEYLEKNLVKKGYLTVTQQHGADSDIVLTTGLVAKSTLIKHIKEYIS